jgi:predicted peptidase
LMPQCPGDSVWVSLAASWARDLPSAADHVDAALSVALRDYRVDEARVALTGLSMGGFGTLIHGAATIDRWCALVAVCGGGRDEDATALARRPLWLLHGAADPIVPKELSLAVHDSVRAAGGNVKLTLYEGVGHNAWDRAYRDPAVIEFLLAER